MNKLPCVINSDLTIDQMFGELIESYIYTKKKLLSNMNTYALYRQNTGILRYKCEFTGKGTWEAWDEIDDDGDMCSVLHIKRTEEPPKDPDEIDCEEAAPEQIAPPKKELQGE